MRIIVYNRGADDTAAKWRGQSGIMLIECLVYFALLFVIIELAFTAYGRTQLSSQQSKNAEDIAAALHAGEQWRQDIRKGTGELTLEQDTLHIPTSDGEIIYAVRDGAVLRQDSAHPQWSRLSHDRGPFQND